MNSRKYALLASAALFATPAFGQLSGVTVQTQLGGQTLAPLSVNSTLNNTLNTSTSSSLGAVNTAVNSRLTTSVNNELNPSASFRE